MPFVKSLPEETTAVTLWGLHPEAYSAWPNLVQATMRSESELSNGEKELIGAYSSALRGCTHCYSAHYPVAIAYGIDPKFFEDVLQDPKTAPIDEKFRPILVFVHKLVTDPNRLVQKDVDPIFAAGWSERTLTDVVFICATFAFMNAIMQGHGAHDADLSDFGPIHAIIREKDQYGHAEGSGRKDPKALMKESIERFGEEATMKAIKRAKELGIGDAL
ncbi:peroxidase [Pseudomaricurvus alkylphenolicus]|uniref:carboxymuconolactone decarboxylase family protein n=1 Tax=Pseudomaricurvus alkylphenolicus TaxID=1306991 RepID=UPI00141DF4AF|nr:carboxymuconolactone decarboxylase family protein [Pseudomaricurvus alkylphenolicus]NIB42290.1 peroxidase [Pseudomaricurvus alkylphenolicus]